LGLEETAGGVDILDAMVGKAGKGKEANSSMRY
jgi:hypothetical protein